MDPSELNNVRKAPPAEMQGVFCRIRRRPPWGTWCTNPRKALFFRSLCTKSQAIFGTRPPCTWCTNPPQSLVLPFSLHQVCGLFRRGAAVDLVHESPAKPCSFVSLAPSLRPFSARGRGGLGARILARPCSSVPFAPSLRVVSRRGRRGLGARIPARPCSSVRFAPSLRVVSRRGRRGLGARIPAKSCSFVRFAPSLRVVSKRGRSGKTYYGTWSGTKKVKIK